ncbi:MAG: hypothetical protein LBO71_10195 [Prevotellaceae bacterium]|nr:hypothetical protein [Prevotellaceae bacterium]
MALAAVLMSASCAKEDPAKPVDYSAPAKQATIKGKLLMNDNPTMSQPKYTAKAGITVIATVPYSELNSGSSSGAFSASTTTDSKGEFTLQVPATQAGVNVSFAVNDVEGSKTVNSAGGTGTETQQGKWSFGIPSATVKSGQSKILDAAFGSFTQIKSVGDEV